jgi:PKD repeat protein
LTVTINVAQETDTIVALASDAPAVAQVAASVTIVAGTISAAISVTAVAPGTANVTASVNGISAATAVTVTPPPPVASSLAPATLTLPKGTPGTLRVTVSHAPSDPTVVALTSSAQAIASVPSTVNIPAGALFADFPVAANSEGQATITARLNGGIATASVTVTPAELATLTLSPQTPIAYTYETVAFTATGTMTDGTSQDFTNLVSWTSSYDAVATIDATGIASALAAGTTTIAASFSFVTAIDGTSRTLSTSTTLVVKEPVALALTATATALLIGNSTTVTVTSSDPAPAGGLAVDLTQSGNGSAGFPASVSIAAGGTSVSFTLTATAAGDVTVTAAAFERLPGSVTLTIFPPLQVNSISPASGPVGTFVTLIGAGFNSGPANNQVTFLGLYNAFIPAVVIAATPTQITVVVPAAARSGPITVTNARGTITSPPFTLTAPPVLQPLSVNVASPSSGATVNGGTVSVSGTFQGPANTGVIANGVAAIISGGNFIAPAVPLQPGTNTIAVTATSPDGRTATQSISVTGGSPAPINVVANPQAGVAPLQVNFSVTNGTSNQITQITADFNGSGTVVGLDPRQPISFSYLQPGTYQASFNLIDSSGTTTAQQLTIVVQDTAQLDQVLQATWNDFTAALTSRNAPQALQFFNAQAQLTYKPVFDVLVANLPDIVASFSALQPVSFTPDIAEYAVIRDDGSRGMMYMIYFLRGADGVWRLDSM